ncbi:hypothetical protein Godav_027971 [Gossypium davidsonii]|uniref:Uncharacterized protein n=1 Tax=Gossypium davidsonii TaxID=34287 RepID=A0A7J8RXT4_GOSDV|nr:hypothetical protein [Gossypium davidsonii]
MTFESRSTTFKKGHSILCPPFLNEENRSNWKAMMKFFVQAFDYGAWKLISKGPLEVLKEEERWDANDNLKA